MAVVTTIGHVPRVTNITLRTKPARTVAGTVSNAEKRTMRIRNANMPGIVRFVTVRIISVNRAPAANFTAKRKIRDWRSEKIVRTTGGAQRRKNTMRRIMSVPQRILIAGTA